MRVSRQFYFFNKKISLAQKAQKAQKVEKVQKAQKAQNANKRFSLKTFFMRIKMLSFSFYTQKSIKSLKST